MRCRLTCLPGAADATAVRAAVPVHIPSFCTASTSQAPPALQSTYAVWTWISSSPSRGAASTSTQRQRAAPATRQAPPGRARCRPPAATSTSPRC